MLRSVDGWLVTAFSRKQTVPIFKDIECLTLGFDVMTGKISFPETSISNYLAMQHDTKKNENLFRLLDGGSLVFDYARDSARCNLLAFTL
jgi:hypothetical protein